MARHKPVKGLLIPADKSKPITKITVRTPDDVERAVGGLYDEGLYDVDSVIFVHGNGRMEGKPRNERVNEWVLKHSDFFTQGRLRNAPPGFGLYGDVVMVGTDADWVPMDLPKRQMKFFEETFGIEQPGPTMGLGL